MSLCKKEKSERREIQREGNDTLGYCENVLERWGKLYVCIMRERERERVRERESKGAKFFSLNG